MTTNPNGTNLTQRLDALKRARASMSTRCRERIRKDPRSQAQIARDTGLHPVTLYKFMAGNKELSIRTLERLSRVLDAH